MGIWEMIWLFQKTKQWTLPFDCLFVESWNMMLIPEQSWESVAYECGSFWQRRNLKQLMGSWYCLSICWMLWFSLLFCCCQFTLSLIFTAKIVFLCVGFHYRRRLLLLWSIVIFSVLVILSQVAYLVIWAVEGSSWSIPGSWWPKLIGFMM